MHYKNEQVHSLLYSPCYLYRSISYSHVLNKFKSDTMLQILKVVYIVLKLLQEAASIHSFGNANCYHQELGLGVGAIWVDPQTMLTR